jgi:tetratricopeptide (TPR) repeat protein
VTGNLRDTGDGAIALTVSLEGEATVTYDGKADELDRLEQQAAEHVFKALDPLNYSLYLAARGRFPEAMAVTESAAAAASDPQDKSEAYSLLSWETERGTGDMSLAGARNRLAISIYPKAAAPHVEIIRDSIVLGHDEEGLAVAREMPNFRAQDQPVVQRGFGFQEILYEAERERDLETGDFAAAQANKCVIKCPLTVQVMLNAEDAARAHDVASSRTLMEKARAAGMVADERTVEVPYFHDVAAGDWQAAVSDARAAIVALKGDKSVSPTLTALTAKTGATSLLARALAESGDLAGAWVAISGTPGDCYDCIRTRGLIAAAAKEWGRADYWFARAVHAAPSVPFAYEDWGRSLLARSEPDRAIAKFTLSNQKGPHFADPLEGWGEALMAKNQSHLALVKFEEAEKCAPNWGRLHLKWGEALVYVGKKDEAKAQFARAATLDLTPAEKSELAQEKT